MSIDAAVQDAAGEAAGPAAAESGTVVAGGEQAAEPTPEQVAAQAAAAELASRKAARIASAEATDRRLAEQREKRQAGRELERARAARADADRYRTEAEEERARNRAAIEAGGIEALKARTGLDYQQLTRMEIAKLDPGVQAQIAYEERLAKQEAATQQMLEKLQRQEERALALQAREELSQCMRSLDASPDTYPLAWDLSEREQRAMIPAVARAIAGEGHDPTEELILARLERSLKELHDEREKRRALRKPATVTQPSHGVTPATTQSSSATGSGLRTLTNDGAAKTALKAETEHELDERLKRELAAALKKDGLKT